MKLKYCIVSLSASILACAFAHAGNVQQIASAGPDMKAYLGAGGVYNEFTFGGLGGAGGSATEETTGFEITGGLTLSHGFSVDGSFEKTYGSAGGGGGAADFSFTDTRVAVNYTHDLGQGFSVIGGLGYGYLGFDVQGFTFSSEGLLARTGVKYQSGQFFGGLTYSHLFSMHTTSASLGGGGGGANALPGVDVATLEAYLGYQINENLAATLSAETQVVGNSVLEKDLGIALGLVYSF